MSQRGLEALLRPKSIAVIGASMKPQRAGYLMMRNLLAGGFNGPVLPVTPAWKAVLGVLAWPTIESLPFTPDLAVLCTNARRNIELLEALGQKGCKTCIILSSPPEQQAELLACAARHQMRLLGPNSLGLLAPWQGLNASFSPVAIHRGKLAFISQSAAVSNTILDWAQQREMGFSYFIALGDSLDIDVDDLLDFLARDSKTSAILLYLEHLSDARRFVSAARSASRNKPILVIKSGRSPAAQKLLHVNSGMDPAWDAAIQRAGLLRVQDTHELFSAVETLSHMRPLRGERLMIISNGAAPAALAAADCPELQQDFDNNHTASGSLKKNWGTSNIFNIISSGDVVPRVLPAEWGFYRNGNDRFLPATVVPEELQALNDRSAGMEGAPLDFGRLAVTEETDAVLQSMMTLFGSRQTYHEDYEDAMRCILQCVTTRSEAEVTRGVILDDAAVVAQLRSMEPMQQFPQEKVERCVQAASALSRPLLEKLGNAVPLQAQQIVIPMLAVGLCFELDPETLQLVSDFVLSTITVKGQLSGILKTVLCHFLETYITLLEYYDPADHGMEPYTRQEEL